MLKKLSYLYKLYHNNYIEDNDEENEINLKVSNRLKEKNDPQRYQKTIEKTMPICYYQFKHYIFRFYA